MTIAADLSDAQARPWLAALDPRLKLAWLLWISSLGILLETTGALVALFCLALLSATGMRMRPRGWLVVVGLLVAIAWSTLLSQAIFYEMPTRTVLLTVVPPFELGGRSFAGVTLYREGAVYGLAQSLRMLSVTLVGLTVCLSTSPERLLAALAQLKMPVAIGFTTVTALRFLPLLIGEWSQVRQARRLRGYRYSGWSLLGPRCATALRWELALFTPVLASALRRASVLATSVASRGFDPTARRTFYPELRFTAFERAALAALAASGIGLLLVKSIYLLHTSQVYDSTRLTPFYDFVSQWL
jgi:energy-coupling factor transporter transmembrane protein EcfT